MPHPTRRHILAAASAAALAQPQPFAPPIGILLATTYTSGALTQRLDEAKTAGLACVQMSMACSGLAEMPDQIPPDLPASIARESAARNLPIASLTATFNMAHPDPAHRAAGLDRLRLLAQSCQPMGTSILHICTGTRNTQSMWRTHPDNSTPQAWSDMAACIRQATAIAAQHNVTLAFEPEVNNVVDSAQKARRLLDEIASPHLKLTFDPANIFHSGELPRMAEILDHAFSLIGRDIVLAHAKDLDHDGDAGHLPAGHGLLDYPRYLNLLRQSNFKGPILLHGLTRAQVPGCLAFLRSKLAQ